MARVREPEVENSDEQVVRRTHTGRRREIRRRPGLRSPFEQDDRPVSSSVIEADVECESIAGLSRDEGARFGAGRVPRPALEASPQPSTLTRTKPGEVTGDKSRCHESDRVA